MTKQEFKNIRERNGLTQEQFAVLLAVKPRIIYAKENVREAPKPSLRDKMMIEMLIKLKLLT